MIKKKFLKEKQKYDSFCQKKINFLLKNFKKFLKQEDNNTVQLINNQLEFAFEDMLLETLNFITRVYQVKTDWVEISEDVILQLTYSKDGMTFKDRVLQYYIEYLEDHDEDKFLNNIERIINTESKYIFNHEVNHLLSDATACELIGGDACDNCLDYLGGGRVDIKKLFDLPPYHPNCNCVIVYYFQTDQADDDWEEEMETDTESPVLVQVQS